MPHPRVRFRSFAFIIPAALGPAVSTGVPPRSFERRFVVGLAVGAVALIVVIAATILLRPPGAAPTSLIVSVTSTAGNWTLSVVASDPSLGIDRVYFLTRTPSGEPYSPLTALANLTFFRDADRGGVLNPGDRVVLPKSEFPAGLTFWFLDRDRLLAVGTLA